MNIGKIINSVRQLLGLAHRGVAKVEKVVGKFDTLVSDLETAIGHIDATTLANEIEVAVKRAEADALEQAKSLENAALALSKDQANALKSKLNDFLGK